MSERENESDRKKNKNTKKNSDKKMKVQTTDTDNSSSSSRGRKRKLERGDGDSSASQKPARKKSKKVVTQEEEEEEEEEKHQGDVKAPAEQPRPRYWLMKNEPDELSIDDLKNSPNQTHIWDGIRSFQARNMLRDEVRPGDLALFYHSSCPRPGIAGIMKVVTVPFPDPAAHPPSEPLPANYKRIWYAFDVQYVRHFSPFLPLSELKKHADEGGALHGMKAFKQPRLSVSRVSPQEWQFILDMEKELT